MPHSQDHCPVCPFGNVTPTSDANLAAIEAAAVMFDVAALVTPDDPSLPTLSPSAREQGLTPARELAALGCASMICNRQCGDYHATAMQGMPIVRFNADQPYPQLS